MAGPKTTLILVRHGETTWNAQKKLQGNTDVALTARGKKQAEATALHLLNYPIDVIYSSPLKRALVTAQKINTHHKVALHTHSSLLERGFGKLEGISYEELWKNYPRFGWPVALEYPWYAPMNSERLIDVERRIGSFLKTVVKKHSGKTIVIVSHGVALRCCITKLLRTPRSFNLTYKMENASLTIIQVQEGREADLHLLGSVDHLEEE